MIRGRLVLSLSFSLLLIGCLRPVLGQSIGGCPVFPANNVWNTRIDSLPVHSKSAAYVSTIGAMSVGHADFGSGTWAGGPIGIPFVTVPGSQPKVPISFDYADESDPGPYPIPPNAPIEGGSGSSGDRHVLVIDTGACILYEVYAAYPQTNGSWTAGSGAIFDLKSNVLRASSWTSADAAGLPIFPGLARYDEVAAGQILHALRFTAPRTQNAFVWPARHDASSITDTNYPPMGTRFRLKASFNISGFSSDTQVLLRAMQQYGLILADNGSSWYVSGAPDERWNNDHLSEFKRLQGSDFEAVDESSLMVDPNSGQADVQAVTGIGVVRESTGAIALDRNHDLVWGTGDSAPTFASPADIVLTGDWTGDGTVKLGIFRPSTGLFVLDTNGNGRWDAGVDAYGYLGAAGDIPVVGDWTGDGRAKVGIFRPSSGLWALDLDGNLAWDTGDAFAYFGMTGDVPVVGDWTGNGKTKVGIFRPGSQVWVLDLNGNLTWDTGIDTFGVFGVAGDIPVVGDWTGNGKAKVGIFRPRTGLWALDVDGTMSWTAGDRYGTFGMQGDVPVVGDWTGDGRTKVGIYRPSNSFWALDVDANLSWSAGIDRSAIFGLPNDTPIVGKWK